MKTLLTSILAASITAAAAAPASYSQDLAQAKSSVKSPPIGQSALTCTSFVFGNPSWMMCEVVGRKTLGIRLIGRSDWASQSVVDQVRIKLQDNVRSVFIDKGMLAQLTVLGTKGADQITLGAQAGTITKRLTSRIKLGNDSVKDVFTFTNNTRTHGPFNHAQRIVIEQFGKEDEIRLANVGRTIRYNDIQKDGSISGVPLLSIRVERLETSSKR